LSAPKAHELVKLQKLQSAQQNGSAKLLKLPNLLLLLMGKQIFQKYKQMKTKNTPTTNNERDNEQISKRVPIDACLMPCSNITLEKILIK